MGLIPLSAHQPHHLDQAELYDFSMPLLQAAEMSWKVSSERPLNCSECLTLSRRLTGEFPPIPVGETDPAGSIVGSEREEVGMGSPLAGRVTEGTTPGTARLEQSRPVPSLVPASSSGGFFLSERMGEKHKG